MIGRLCSAAWHPPGSCRDKPSCVCSSLIWSVVTTAPRCSVRMTFPVRCRLCAGPGEALPGNLTRDLRGFGKSHW